MKKLLSVLCALGIFASICGCSKSEAQAGDESIVNPILEVTEDEFVKEVGIELGIPSDAKDVKRFIYLVDGSIEVLGEAQYSLDGKEYVQRVLSTDKTSFDDIDDKYIESFTGCYYTWTENEDANVAYCAAKVMSCDEAKVVVWLDVAPGIIYSISTTDTSVSNDELIKIATDSFIPMQQDS